MSINSIAQSEVYGIVTTAVKQIQQANSQEEWLEGLHKLNGLLTGVSNSPLQSNQNEVMTQFTTRYYAMSADAIIKTLPKWSKTLNTRNQVQYIDSFFLKGPCHQALLALSNIFNSSR